MGGGVDYGLGESLRGQASLVVMRSKPIAIVERWSVLERSRGLVEVVFMGENEGEFEICL